jgi:hypothetical protein
VVVAGCEGGVIVYGSDDVIGGRSSADNAEESGIALRLKLILGLLSTKV